MAVLIESSNGPRPRRNPAARAAFILGLLGAATLPVAIAVAEYRDDLELIQAGWAVPVAFLLSVLAVWLARRARRNLERSLGRAGGEKQGRAGRLLGWLGVYSAVTAAVSLAVYAYLEHVASK